jgi:hypothetical protein
MARQRDVSAGQYDGRAMVAAHGVKRDANLIRHGSLSALTGLEATQSLKMGDWPRP